VNFFQLIMVVLTISIFANVGFGIAMRNAWKDEAIAEERLAKAVEDAKACSDGVAAMERAAEERKAKAIKEMEKASEEAWNAINRARRQMSASPSDKSDLCASSLAMSRHKIRERQK